MKLTRRLRRGPEPSSGFLSSPFIIRVPFFLIFSFNMETRQEKGYYSGAQSSNPLEPTTPNNTLGQKQLNPISLRGTPEVPLRRPPPSCGGAPCRLENYGFSTVEFWGLGLGIWALGLVFAGIEREAFGSGSSGHGV